jgi:hypothetical protein
MLTGYMLYTMLIVLGVMALDMLAGLYKSMITNSFSFAALAKFLKSGILFYVLPLLVLASLSQLSTMNWLVMILYYIGALGVVVKYLMDILNKMKR